MDNKQLTINGFYLVRIDKSDILQPARFNNYGEIPYFFFTNGSRMEVKMVFEYKEFVSVPTPEAPDKVPSAEEYFKEYLINLGIGAHNVVTKDITKVMESFALLREQRAVEVERKKWESEKLEYAASQVAIAIQVMANKR